MNIVDRLTRWLSPNDIHRQLYPRPRIDFEIRPYLPNDRSAVLALHDENAQGRFPEGHRPVFERFLEEPSACFFVAESATNGIIACGGVNSGGPNAHTLCYGMVRPEFQRNRVGATLALARIAFATRTNGPNVSIIFAVHKSVGYYRQFGYNILSNWKGEDQKDYPIGALVYDAEVIEPIEKILSERNHAIDAACPLVRHPSSDTILTDIGSGQYRIEIKPSEDKK